MFTLPYSYIKSEADTPPAVPGHHGNMESQACMGNETTPRKALKIVFSSPFYFYMQAESSVVHLISLSLARNILAQENRKQSPARGRQVQRLNIPAFEVK